MAGQNKRKFLYPSIALDTTIPTSVILTNTENLQTHKRMKKAFPINEDDMAGGVYVFMPAAPQGNQTQQCPSKFLTGKTIHRWILHGRDEDEEGDILLLLPNGEMTPWFLPDLGDMALIPLPIKLLVEWHLQKTTIDEWKTHFVANRVVRDMMIQSPIIPKVREVVLVKDGWNKIEYGGYSDCFKVIRITRGLKVVSVVAKLEWFTTSNRDGRKWTVMLKATMSPFNSSSMRDYVVWNCRGLGRSSFIPHMDHITEKHNPTCVLLTETRVSARMARSITKFTKTKKTLAMNSHLGNGGASIMLLGKELKIEMQVASHGQVEWNFKYH